MRTNEWIQTSDVDDDNAVPAVGGRRTIAEFIADEVLTLTPETTLREAAIALRTADVSLAVVSDGQQVNGVISERDIVAAIALGADLDAAPVGTMETASLKCATPESTVDDVAEEMLGAYVRHILVRHEDGTLAGVVSMRDLLTAYLV
ncbi:MAG: CBS domain-containing protein [Ilumatobacter sp.]|jgi:CBS domain-containing protein